MDEDVADGVVINLHGVDIATILSETAGPGMKTALDRLLLSNASSCNGFNNSIELSGSLSTNYAH
jgi:hypothetical protein